MRENPLGGKAGHAHPEAKPEQIVTILRQIEVGIANGKTTPGTFRTCCISAQQGRVMAASLQSSLHVCSSRILTYF
jgi:hypothetical protein